ncbi:MAG: AIPR family protein, partial [Selenomonadaceae bacterium]|nr:AIPR family protein [Selenomonadaceae bacterium]
KSEQKVDNAINSTIKNNPESFWLKNNGITITCDNFRISGREVHLENFSIVNGGQTTYLLNKNKKLIDAHDFYLPCKIIKNVGNTEQERIQFSSKIAEAANSQKPIKPADLLANAPEQLRFAKAMLAVDLFYQTKRGEEIPPKYHRAYLHTKLEEVGKLCLAAIFQEPCKSRNNPSVAYKHIDEGDKNPYYKTIFNGNQFQVAQICKELLYIDSYFPTFRKKFDTDNEGKPNAEYRKDFAHIARRTCVAFVALAARVHQDNLTDENIATLTSEKSDKKVLYEMLRNLGDMKFLLPIKLYTDDYKAALDKLFTLFIQNGVRVYKLSKIPATNFFKAEQNYYDILSDDWEELKSKINKIFAGI